MLKAKCCVNRKPRRWLRVLVIVFGFGCLLHLTHRECAPISDKFMQEIASRHAVAGASGISGLEDFHATAYCVTGITRSGVMAAPGHVAADPKVIPLGSMIYVDSPLMGGIYQVCDTGELIKGRIIDIFIPSYERCREFGRRMVKVKVLRYGFLGDPPKEQAARSDK
jgi:3D (Asp-Asp-Asp) domain-containing protein